MAAVDITRSPIEVRIGIIGHLELRIVVSCRSKRVRRGEHITISKSLIRLDEKRLVLGLSSGPLLQDRAPGRQRTETGDSVRIVQIDKAEIPQQMLIHPAHCNRKIVGELMRISAGEL